jgi:predicted dienelactone hydrolase
MRLFEVLILITILPTLVGYFFAPTRRPQWLAYLPGIGILLIVIHLIVEGYRVHMVPAYALTIILLIPAIRIIVRRAPQSASETHLRRWKVLRIGGAVLGLLLFVIAAVLPALFPVFRLPEPTGPYAVGTTSYHLVDAARQESLTADPNDQRELLVQAWYPAELPPDGAPVVYMEHPPLLLDNLSLVRTHSYRDATVSSDQSSYPVIIFSHGYGMSLLTQNTVQMEAFASRGYIVFSIGHPFDSLKTVYPDGSSVSLDFNRFKVWGEATTTASAVLLPKISNSTDPAEKETLLRQFLAEHLIGDEIVRLWTDDTVFVMDELEKIQTDAHKSVLAGKLDLERLGLFGHSLGGATAGQVCMLDSRCKAGINMDGAPWGDVIDHAPEQPFMFMYSEPPGFDGAADPIYERAANTVYRVTIRGSAHTNYGEMSLWVRLPLWVRKRAPMVVGPIDAQRALNIVTEYTLAFFNAHLNNVDSPLLEGPSPDYPEVDFQSRNR